MPSAVCRSLICCWLWISAVACVQGEELLAEAAGLQHTGQCDAALATYALVFEQYSEGPAYTEALWQTAQIHDRLGQDNQARARYVQLLAQSPSKPSAAEVLFALAWVDQRSGRQASALKSFQKLYANHSQSAQAPEAAYWLASSAADEKRSDAALRYLDQTLSRLSWTDVVPESRAEQLLANATCLKAQVAASASRWQLVCETVEAAPPRLLDVGSTGLQAQFWLAEAQFRLGQHDKAKQVLLKLEPRVQNLGQAWASMVPLRLAQLAAARQRWSEVLERTKQILQNDADFALRGEVQFLRGVALAGRGEMSAARRAYRRVLKDKEASQLETTARAQWMIGESFFHQRDLGQARAAYLQVIENHNWPDWQARAALQAGKCWELEGNWQEAHTLYETALRRWPGAQPHPQLRARLKWAERHPTPPTRLH